MKVKFAPLNIPISRRLQTLAAFYWITSLVFGSLLCWLVLLYNILFSNYWYLGLLYAAWAFYDRETPFKGGRRWPIFRYLPIWKYFVDYFPIRLVKTAEITPDKNYLFCSFPHGVLSAGVFGNFATVYSESRKLFPNLKIYGSTLDIHFKNPIFREYILGLGGVSSSKESITYIMNSEKKGHVCTVVVGGAAEALYCRPGPYKILLNKRKGFIKIALSTGCSLVPVFSFGEIDVYDQVTAKEGTKLQKFQNWCKKQTGIAFLILKGRGVFQYSFGVVPYRAPITTVVGAPIDVPKIPNFTEEDVNHYHELFKTKLEDLFNEHKGKYVNNPESTNLEII